MKTKNSNKAAYNQYLKYSGLAFQMLAVLGLAIWGGLSLDRYLGLSFPAFTILLSLSAVVGVIVLLIRSMPKY